MKVSWRYITRAIATLKRQGATVVEVELMKDINPLGKDEFVVLEYEFKDGLNKYLAAAASATGASAGLPKSLADIIAFQQTACGYCDALFSAGDVGKQSGDGWFG